MKSSIIDEDVKRILENDLPWDVFRGKTILITGASGMIPSYFLYTFLALNDLKDMDVKVIALVRNGEKAKRVLGSMLDRDDVTLVCQDVAEPLEFDGRIDYVFHGGSAARPAQHKTSPTSTIRANLVGTFNLLDRAVKDKSEAFVLMSSSEVYGQQLKNKDAERLDSDDSKPLNAITEDDYGRVDTLDPRSCYSEGKRAAETICACYNAEYGIRVLCPRFAHIYGPGLALDDGRVQADFAANVIKGEDIVMNSDGSSVRAYTYVADACAGVFYALLKGDGIAYNISDNNSIISIRELAEAFVASRPEKGLKVVIKAQIDGSRSYNKVSFIGLDGSRLEALGWKAEVQVGEGTKRMISHYEETGEK
ncbi:MAG: NAD-dependent epimerase/dehydratase family protein [Eubacterium sp.]|nr:NAD-dependent epimerase/dehydratase family protein [Eubacterium sp.]